MFNLSQSNLCILRGSNKDSKRTAKSIFTPVRQSNDVVTCVGRKTRIRKCMYYFIALPKAFVLLSFVLLIRVWEGGQAERASSVYVRGTLLGGLLKQQTLKLSLPPVCWQSGLHFHINMRSWYLDIKDSKYC